MSLLPPFAYLLVQIPSLALSGWSFKLHKNVFSPTDAGLTTHEEGGILGAGVCALGKIGAWVIIIWIILSSIILLSNRTSEGILGVLITHSILVFILIVLTLVMNPQLFVRTLPFILLQIGIILFLADDYINSKKK
jgi:hypothetical protein